nr:PDZ domain-containing protein GIPC2 [Leptinotarsa decemlineata]
MSTSVKMLGITFDANLIWTPHIDNLCTKLTITDNGAGYSFIKRIKEGSIIHSISHIQVGDHIEKLDGENMVGKRHFEVAKALQEIPKGTTFTIRLVEPMKSGFSSISPNTGRGSSEKKSYGSGRETLRFKAGGEAEIEERVRYFPDILSGILKTGIHKKLRVVLFLPSDF